VAILFLDHQPVLGVFSLHPHQGKSALETISFQQNNELTLFQGLEGVMAFHKGIGPEIPNHHDAGAVLTLRDDPFKIDILEWVILHLDGQPFVCRIQGRPFGNSPGFEDSAHLQAEIPMELSGLVLVYDETTIVFQVGSLPVIGSLLAFISGSLMR